MAATQIVSTTPKKRSRPSNNILLDRSNAQDDQESNSTSKRIRKSYLNFVDKLSSWTRPQVPFAPRARSPSPPLASTSRSILRPGPNQRRLFNSFPSISNESFSRPATSSRPLATSTPHPATTYRQQLATPTTRNDNKWEILLARASGREPPALEQRTLSRTVRLEGGGLADRNVTSSHSTTYVKKKPMGDLQRKNSIKERDLQRLALLAKQNEAFAGAKQQGYAADRNTFDELVAYRSSISQLNIAEALEASPTLVLSRKISKKTKTSDPSDSLARAIQAVKLTTAEPDYTKPRLEAWERLRAEQEEQETPEEVPRRRKFPRKLAAENQRIVTETLRQNGIISTLPGAEVSAKDIRKLQGLQWLNDEVITFYAIMLNLRSIAEDKRLAEGGKARKSGDGGEEALLKTHCFTSFMYAKLSTDGYAGVRRWTRKVDIFSKDIVIVPINLGNSHWVCSAINITKKRFEYYDSLGRASEVVYKRLRQYLNEEHLDKKKSALDLSDWTNHWDDDVPQQENSSDCGIFTCQFMECLSRCEGFDFNQEQMPYFRNKMVLEIKQSRLIPEEFE